MLVVEIYDAQGNHLGHMDLSILSAVDHFITLIQRRIFQYVHLGTPCGSFSVLQTLFNHGPQTANRPQGDGTRANEKHGNLLLAHSILIIDACTTHNMKWTLENPARSFMFQMPRVCRLLRQSSVYSVLLDQCMFGLCDPGSGLPYKKPTRIIWNFPEVLQLPTRCNKLHKHEQVIGKVRADGSWISRSALAGAYPAQLCARLIPLVLRAVQSDASQRQKRLAQA